MRLSDLEPNFSYHILNELKDTVKYEFKWKTIDGGSCTRATTRLVDKDDVECALDVDFFNFRKFSNYPDNIKGCEVGYSIDKIHTDVTGRFRNTAFKVMSAVTQALTIYLKEKQSFDFVYLSSDVPSKQKMYKTGCAAWARQLGWVMFQPYPTSEILKSPMYSSDEKLNEHFFICKPELKDLINTHFFNLQHATPKYINQSVTSIFTNSYRDVSSIESYDWRMVTNTDQEAKVLITTQKKEQYTVSLKFDSLKNTGYISAYWILQIYNSKGREPNKIKDKVLLGTLSEVIYYLVRSKSKAQRDYYSWFYMGYNDSSNYSNYNRIFRTISTLFGYYNSEFESNCVDSKDITKSFEKPKGLGKHRNWISLSTGLDN